MADRISQLKEMLLQEPGDTFLQYALAMEYFALNDVKESILLLEKIIESNPNYLATYYQLGQCYTAQNQKEKALHIFEAGKKIAQQQDNTKTLGELNNAILLLEED